MALTGKETDLKAALVAAITTAITNAGNPPIAPNQIETLSEGIANALIPFLVANTAVATTVTVLPHPPGGAAIGTGTGTIS